MANVLCDGNLKTESVHYQQASLAPLTEHTSKYSLCTYYDKTVT